MKSFKGFKMILKNSSRNAIRSKSQLFNLTILTTIFALVLFLITQVSTRVWESYDDLKTTSNIHHGVVQLDPFDNVPTSEQMKDDETYKDVPRNNVEAQQYWIYQLQQYAKEDLGVDLVWSRTEAKEFSQQIWWDGEYALTLKVVAKTFSDYEGNNQDVDKLVIFEGHDIEHKQQVVLDPVFAKNHGIKLGDVIRISKDSMGSQLLVNSEANLEQGTSEEQLKQLNDMVSGGDITRPDSIYNTNYKTFNWLQVVGFGSSVDFATPIVSTSPIPNRKTEALIYVSPDQFGLKQKEKNIRSDNASEILGLWEYDQASDNLVVNSNSEWESFYSLKFIDMNNPGEVSPELEKALNDKFKLLIQKEGLSRNYIFANWNTNYRFYSRIATIESTLVIYNAAIGFILAIILIVVLYTTGLMTRKQIEKTRSQIGTLKALGYNKRILVFNYIMTPTITAILGGVLGFLLSLSVQNPIANKFSEYFVLDYGQLSFDWIGFLMIVMIWVVLTAVAFLIAYLIMRKDALGLLSTSVKGKVSKWGIFLKTLSAKRSFTGRLKTALLIDASGKMVAIGVVVFLATASITISFAAPDLLIRNQELSMKGLNYRQLIEYESPIYNNPYSFLKTYNIAESEAEKQKANDEGRKLFEWKDSVQATTALPTVEEGMAVEKGYGEGYTGYDVKKLSEDLYDNKQTNEFYSIILNGIGKGEVNPMDLSIANVRFLQGYGLTASVDFYKTISTYAVYDDSLLGIWKVLSKQWPDATVLYNEMTELDETEESIIRGLQLMQNFYKEYVDAPALSITKNFYNSDLTSQEDIIKDFNSYASPEQKGFLPKPARGAEGAWKKLLKKNSGEMSKSLLEFLEEVELEMAFVADDENKIYNFHIENPSWYTGDPNLEYYLTLQPEELKGNEDEAKQALKAYITWYAALFSHRPDQGVIQAAYSRSPYFVQQFFKKAALEEKVYSHGFGTVSIDPEQEALGTKVAVSSGETDFNLYGVDNTPQFREMINLVNSNNDSLLDRLFDNSESSNEIILNQSAAKKLNISEGDIVDLDVIQEALYDDNKQVEMENWEDSDKKTEGNIIEEGFVPYTKMIPVTTIDIFGQKLPSIHSASLNGTSLNGSAINPEASGKYYDKVRAGTIYNDVVTNVHTGQATKFKVVGIHDGYGEPQGWIKNSDAHNILGYDEFEEYMYKKQFQFQWGNGKNGVPSAIKGLPEELNDLKKNLNTEYDTAWGTPISGEYIYQMFQHEFPIFDYKYSQKEDVGDLEVTVQFFQQYGDYNPVTLNGNTKGVDGSGQGAMSLIMPTEMKEAILQQITDLAMMMIIFMNVFILAITFVIIFLTTSLIINDNVRFIATMKVLGYGNGYIAKSVLGMYFIVIATMFVAAIGIGWFSFASIVRALPIVMPLAFPVWLVFAVALAVIGIYVIAISSGFRLIAKTNATLVLKEGDI